jgi:hypothetical protein
MRGELLTEWGEGVSIVAYSIYHRHRYRNLYSISSLVENITLVFLSLLFFSTFFFSFSYFWTMVVFVYYIQRDRESVATCDIVTLKFICILWCVIMLQWYRNMAFCCSIIMCSTNEDEKYSLTLKVVMWYCFTNILFFKRINISLNFYYTTLVLGVQVQINIYFFFC